VHTAHWPFHEWYRVPAVSAGTADLPKLRPSHTTVVPGWRQGQRGRQIPKESDQTSQDWCRVSAVPAKFPNWEGLSEPCVPWAGRGEQAPRGVLRKSPPLPSLPPPWRPHQRPWSRNAITADTPRRWPAVPGLIIAVTLADTLPSPSLKRTSSRRPLCGRKRFVPLDQVMRWHLALTSVR
jgi:hypothetical protein